MSTTTHDTGFYDPDKHDNQVVAVFEDRAAAESARESLLAAGVPASAVEVVGELRADATPEATPADDQVGEQILGAFMSLFTPQQEHHEYQQAVERGHAMVVISSAPGLDRHKAIQVLEQANPIDFDAKLAEWRSAGYEPEATSGNERREGRRETLEGTRVRSYVADRQG